MSGSAFAITHHAFSSRAGRTSDGNGSHASTLKSPSYTKSVSWQHYRLPELVEGVCHAYKKKYGQDLTGHYLEVLKPCIVCFRADIDYEKGALEAALSYAYTSVRELPPDSGAVFGIDRHGKSVSVDEIVNVEFI